MLPGLPPPLESLVGYKSLKRKGMLRQKIIRFICGNKIVVFHCSACMLQDFLQSLMINAPGLPPPLLHTVSNLKLDNRETRLTENVLLGFD